MTDIDLDAIEKCANAAEDGPWEVAEHPHPSDNPDGWPLIVIRSTTGKRREVAAVIEDDVASASETPRENAEFMARARTDVPKMAAKIRDQGEQLFAQQPVINAVLAWAELLETDGSAPDLASKLIDIHDAVEQYRLMDHAITAARTEQPEATR